MNNTPKRYQAYTLVLLITAAAALIVCAAAFRLKRDPSLAVQGNPEQSYLSYYSPKPSPSQETAKSQVSSSSESVSSQAASTPEEEYLITIYNGKIGVFRENQADPFLTADRDVYLLPKEDVEILKKGIRVQGFTAVKSVLEDYE